MYRDKINKTSDRSRRRGEIHEIYLVKILKIRTLSISKLMNNYIMPIFIEGLRFQGIHFKLYLSPSVLRVSVIILAQCRTLAPDGGEGKLIKLKSINVSKM